MTQTIDANGAIHDAKGRFDGHVQAEGDTAVLPAPALSAEFREAAHGAYESAATAAGDTFGRYGWGTCRPGIPEVFELVDGDLCALRVIPNPKIDESAVEVAMFAANDINTYFGPGRSNSDGYDGPIVTAKLDTGDRSLVRLTIADRYAQPVLEAAQWSYLDEAAGMFEEGYDEGDVDKFAQNLAPAVEIRCVWEYTDSQGMGGTSEIIGRVPGGIWRPLSDDFAEFLYSGDETSATPESLLGYEPFQSEFDVDDLMFTNGYNVAPEKRGGSYGRFW
jgi:hypothetical protein